MASAPATSSKLLHVVIRSCPVQVGSVHTSKAVGETTATYCTFTTTTLSCTSTISLQLSTSYPRTLPGALNESTKPLRMAPQSGVNGVLPVAVLQKNAPASAPRGPKAAQPRLKLVLRRLPPGITQAELEAILGEDWKVGAGKIDYSLFKKGKVSKEYASALYYRSSSS